MKFSGVTRIKSGRRTVQSYRAVAQAETLNTGKVTPQR